MDPHFRKLYNAQFTQERYAWFQRELSQRLNCTFEFRLAETPLFLSDDFKSQAVKAANEIIAQLSEPTRLVKAGDSWLIGAGKVHNANVVGDIRAKVLSTYVVEKGKPLATPAP